MIRVGINARALPKPDPAGVSRYTGALLEALADRTTTDGRVMDARLVATQPVDRARETDGGRSVADTHRVAGAGETTSPNSETEFEYVLFGLDALPDGLRGHDRVVNGGEPAAAHSGLRAHRWEQFDLPRAIGEHDLDVFHTPAGQPPLLESISKRLGSEGPALVTTIHDVSPIAHPEWFSRGYAALYRALTPLAVRASNRILTVSEFARDEIVATYPKATGTVVPVHNGVTPLADPGESVGGLAPGKFLLFVGSVNRRKNVETLLRAYRRYRSQVPDPVPLVLAGPERDVFAKAGYDLPDGVRTLGYVSDAELGWLYRNAAAFVFPSLYEGFGLPILEAMCAGTPVVTSDRGAMAEVAGDAAELVDPLDAEELAAGVERVLRNESYRDRLVVLGHERAESFTWDRAAAQTEEVYREAAEQ